MARVSTGGDQYQWLELSAYLLGRSAAEADGVIEQIKDVTKLSHVQARLRDEAGLRHILVDESRDGIVVLDQHGKVCQANKQFAHMLGSTVEETQHTHVWDWDIQWEKERILEVLQRAEIASERFDICLRCGSGSPVHVEIASNGVMSAGKRFVYWVCRDVTEKRALQQQIRELNIRDPQTGLYNRRYLLERLAETSAEYLRSGSGFCISIFDLDHFRKVNEVHGPMAADLALEELARIIGAAVRPYDLVGRFAGDEFIIVSKNATQLETEAVVHRLMAVIRDRDFTCEGSVIRLSLSCGLAYCGESPKDAFSVEAIIALANERLNEAKLAGGDRCVSGVAAAG
jgi:diguanylate cyclase (GGDEF)-like protein/PAS domain S-box-containing protein